WLGVGPRDLPECRTRGDACRRLRRAGSWGGGRVAALASRARIERAGGPECHGNDATRLQTSPVAPLTVNTSRCGHLSKAGTRCPPHLSVDVVDRPCVPLGGPTLGAPTTEVQLGWGLPIQEQEVDDPFR